MSTPWFNGVPGSGASYNFTPFSKLRSTEIEEAITVAASNAIQAVMTMLCGDPAIFGYGRRGYFRQSELAALVAVDNANAPLDVWLTMGSALINGGTEDQKDWYYIGWSYQQFLATRATLAAAHPSQDRHDVICIIPKRVEAGSVSREVVDANGNVSVVTDTNRKRDAFDFHIIQGTPGVAAQTRAQLLDSLAPGIIPIASIRIPAGATTLDLEDITDLRELMIFGQNFIERGFDNLGASIFPPPLAIGLQLYLPFLLPETIGDFPSLASFGHQDTSKLPYGPFWGPQGLMFKSANGLFTFDMTPVP